MKNAFQFHQPPSRVVVTPREEVSKTIFLDTMGAILLVYLLNCLLNYLINWVGLSQTEIYKFLRHENNEQKLFSFLKIFLFFNSIEMKFKRFVNRRGRKFYFELTKWLMLYLVLLLIVSMKKIENEQNGWKHESTNRSQQTVLHFGVLMTYFDSNFKLMIV